MEQHANPITLVDPGERHALRVGGSVLYYRRLSLGALASLERAVALPVQTARGAKPVAVVPPAALEQALCGHVLVGWHRVLGPDGLPVPFGPRAAGMLPSAVRSLLINAARQPEPPQPHGETRDDPDHRP